MDFIEREGAVSDELTSLLLAVSGTGRPLRVKRAAKTRETRGQFRRIQVANSREIRWRKPVKSAKKWQLVTHWVRADLQMALIYRTCQLMAAMWGTARYRYVPSSRSAGFRLHLFDDSSYGDVFFSGAQKVVIQDLRMPLVYELTPTDEEPQ
jgi:hypothetical protein